MNEGLITVQSSDGAAPTLDRLQAAIQAAGNTVFAVFDHAAAARQAGLALRPTTVVAFGNPVAGTKLMLANQVTGIDLPLKVLVWEDESGAAKMTYADPRGLAQRHKLSSEIEPVMAAMAGLLDSLTRQAANSAKAGVL